MAYATTTAPGSGSGFIKWTFSKLSPSSSSSRPADPLEQLRNISQSKSTESTHAMSSVDSDPSGWAASQPCMPPTPTSPRTSISRNVLRDSSNVHNVSTPRRRRESMGARLKKAESNEIGEENSRLKAENEWLKTQNASLFERLKDALISCDSKEERLCTQEGKVRSFGESLDCPICMCRYEEPFFLSCGHSFCVFCLQAWFASIAESQVPTSHLLHPNTCPICRAIVLIPIPAYMLRTIVEQFGTLVPKTPTAVSYDRPIILRTSNNDVIWEGIFEEELEGCVNCGGLARYGQCLGFAGVAGRDQIVDPMGNQQQQQQQHGRADVTMGEPEMVL